MTELAIFKLIRDVLLAGFAAQGMGAVRVKRSYASTKSSAPDAPAIIMHRIDSQRVGWSGRRFYKEDNAGHQVTMQNHAITFQFNALVPVEDEESLDTLTAGDLLDTAALILQSRAMIDTCKAAGIGIERISAIRSNYVQNENDDWEQEPSFDLVVDVRKELITSVNVVTSTDIKIYPV